MTISFAQGGPDCAVAESEQLQAVRAAIRQAGDVSRVLVLPPDYTRLHSGAGLLTRVLYQELKGQSRVFDVMPALGTHRSMDASALRRMFGDQIPLECFKEHKWRSDIVRLGTVPSDYVHEVSEGVLKAYLPDYDIPVEVNRRIVEGGYTAIISIGQVLPHEVVGMANGVKNILVGAGGAETINKTHFLGAAYGMERMMGRPQTPVRAVLDRAHDLYLKELGIVYVLTVMARASSGRHVMRGIYVGMGTEAFQKAAELSRQVNVTLLEEPLPHVVAYLDPGEFHSTWLGNKAIYRTRMAIADGGQLTVIAPGVKTFGEDPEIDRLIREHGYRGTPAILDAVRRSADLRANLSAAAHLIHGSSEGRFQVIYATDPSRLPRREVEEVGFQWMDVADAVRHYGAHPFREGPHCGAYYIGSPALGLWAERQRFMR